MSKKYTFLTLKGICMNFLLELIFFKILSHPVTFKQPHKIVQIHMRQPVMFVTQLILNEISFEIHLFLFLFFHSSNK